MHVERDGGRDLADYAACGHDAGGPMLRLAARMRGAQFLDGGPVDETAEPEVEEGAQLYELVDAHLALAVEHVPEPLTVNADPTSQLGYADSSLTSRAFDETDDGILVYLVVFRRVHSGLAGQTYECEAPFQAPAWTYGQRSPTSGRDASACASLFSWRTARASTLPFAHGKAPDWLP